MGSAFVPKNSNRPQGRAIARRHASATVAPGRTCALKKPVWAESRMCNSAARGPSYQGEEVMESISRRYMLAATVAGGC
jgi:hypothetical protein